MHVGDSVTQNLHNSLGTSVYKESFLDRMEVTSNLASPILNDCETSIGSLLPYNGPRASIIPIPNKKPGKLDDIRFNGWLDAMKSSSPTSKSLFIRDCSVETALEDLDLAYCAWMLKHPSALKSFKQMMEQARTKRIVIFLDYDGTLSPIVDEPDRALLSKDMHLAVKNVAKHFPAAIISGRSREKVFELVGLTELYYAGSHGMDIMVPTPDRCLNHPELTNHEENELKLFQPAKEFLPMIDEVYRTLIEKTKSIKGAKVENHKFCASVHYRNVDAKEWATVAQSVHDILNNYPDLRITHGRKVLEVRPAIDWNKGKAVEFLLNSLGSVNGDDILPIYIGDDRTDEDAFKILRDRGSGFGILVSAVPKETKAFYSLRNTAEVMEFLKLLVSWKKKKMEEF